MLRALLVMMLLLMAGCTEPRNYQECIYQRVTPSMSDHAAKAIQGACWAEFSGDAAAREDARTTRMVHRIARITGSVVGILVIVYVIVRLVRRRKP